MPALGLVFGAKPVMDFLCEILFRSVKPLTLLTFLAFCAIIIVYSVFLYLGQAGTLIIMEGGCYFTDDASLSFF